jgi:hypothetical protein
MFCPGCSAESPDGAKFCKSCGMNLTVVTNVLSGGPTSVDPIRDREYKRARKKISDGIQGSAVGLALIAGAVLIYVFLPKDKLWYGLSLAAALAGMIVFFRSLGNILDAKVGPRFVDPSLQPRATGPLTGPLRQPTVPAVSSSKRLPAEVSRALPEREAAKSQSIAKAAKPIPKANTLQPPTPMRTGTGRAFTERPGPDKLTSDDLMSKLRN